MHEKKAIPLAAVAVIALLLGTVIQQSAVYGAPSSKTPSPRPILKVKVSRHVCEAGELVHVWFYITNPSTDMATWGKLPPELGHIVEVNSISLECILPDGTGYERTFVPPDASLIPPTEWVDTTVYPMETSMVFYIGLAHTEGVGTYEYNCTANVTLHVTPFEEETLSIQRTFRVQAQRPHPITP